MFGVGSSKTRITPARRKASGLWWTLPAVAFLTLGPAAGRGEPARAAASEEARTAEDLLIVDCLLPPKLRRLGRQRTYLAPRQPVRDTAVNCRIRGGEYTEPDQASYATALKVWLPQAEAGNPEAQFHVGQIFEKGLGIEPDYRAAALWYRRAAEQEYAPAQIDLGYLYERGLGVEEDRVAALNWYRKAAGLAENLVVLEQSELAALEEARAEVEAARAEADELRREIEELRRQLDEIETEGEEANRARQTLESVVSRLEGQLEQQKVEVTRREDLIATLEQRLAAAESPEPAASGATPSAGQIDFGKYHALVIGNGAYERLPDLETAISDAREMAALLEKKYGFEVRLLINATRYQTMTALNDLREALTEESNLLIYYAGHGQRDEERGAGYWQPVDAEPDSPANWIPSEVVTEHLDLVPSRHVLVVADSVYSGLRTRASIARLPRGMSDEQRFHHIRLLLEKRARLVLTSGGSSPRPAAAESGHSSFSAALLSVLRDNDGVLEASRCYQRVVERLTKSEGEEVPEFATMRWARNNVADFFFVPGS